MKQKKRSERAAAENDDGGKIIRKVNLSRVPNTIQCHEARALTADGAKMRWRDRKLKTKKLRQTDET